jgi:hypothetical protein
LMMKSRLVRSRGGSEGRVEIRDLRGSFRGAPSQE